MQSKDIKKKGLRLWHGDCLELMKRIPDNAIDMVLTDPPYGTTACKWDIAIPFEPMWKELKRITKENGAICPFGTEPFSSRLRMSNLKMFKYDWIWQKNRHSNFLHAKHEPRRVLEIISIFYASRPYYNPQMIEASIASQKRNNRARSQRSCPNGGQYSNLNTPQRENTGQKLNYPLNIIKFNLEQNNQYVKKVFHPTQKPVDLLKYLIKTYTLENETILDFTMGSGSTGVASLNLNRKFIGIEKDSEYFEIAKKRILQ